MANAEKKSKKMTYEEIIRLAASTGAEAGVEKYKAELATHQKSVTDKKFRNTKALLKQYRALRDYAENAVFSTEQLESFQIAELISGITDSDKFKVESIQNQVATTKTIMMHVETMLQVYKNKCLASEKDEVRRRWRVIERMYLCGESQPEIFSIAESENIDGRTVYKDIDKACDELSNLIFGLDLNNFVI
ncbi:MAG: hypothetical protein IKP95_09275 [Ruminococcus sp.]|nr:hypothetical protein [Ruminococcus sp.]